MLTFKKVNVIYVKFAYIIVVYSTMAVSLKLLTGKFLPNLFTNDSVIIINILTVVLNIWFITSVVSDKKITNFYRAIFKKN